MAGIKKTDMGTEVNVTAFLYNLVSAVGKKEIEWPEAQKKLSAYLAEMTPEERTEWRKQIGEQVRRLQYVAEAFSQELTVLASNQG